MKLPLSSIIRFCFILSGTFLFVFCISYFFSENRVENAPDNTVATSLVLDVSQSMQVEDVSGISRLDAVKRELEKKLIGELGPLGITIFAGEAQRVLPFTTQKDLLMSVLLTVDSKNLQKQGTDIVSAVEAGVRQFLPEQRGTLIILSDGGEQSIGDTADIKQKIQDQNLELIIVGVGSSKGGNILLGRDVFGSPIYKNYKGQRVVSKLEDTSLKQLAQKLGGQYMSFESFQRENLLGNASMVQGNNIYILFFLAFLFWLIALSVLIFQKETGKY